MNPRVRMEPRLPAGRFFGRTSKSLAVSGCQFTEVAYPPGLDLPAHSHELAKFCFVLSGSFTETLGKESRLRTPLSLSFQPAGITHSERHQVAGRHLLIEIPSRWLKRLGDYSGTLDQPVEVHTGAPVWLASKLYDEFRTQDGVTPLAVEALGLELLVETFRSTRGRRRCQPPRWLAEVKEILHERFAEKLSLSELAAQVSVHPVHLARTFRRYCRATVGEYKRDLRIRFAWQQIAKTQRPLAEIALAAGFSDQSHLSRTLKALTGMTPHQIRVAIGSGGGADPC